MNTYRKTAVLVGLFFIIGTVSGVLSMMFIGSFLDDPEYLTAIAASENTVVLGAICILTMGFALTMIPIVLYPIFKKINATLALGAVVFRGALEAVVYIAQAVLWLLLLSVSQNFIAAGSADVSVFQTIGALFIAADTWLAHTLSIVFSLGALMIYWVFYVSKLIPRWLSIWGLIGGILYFVAPIAGLFDIDLGFLMLPLALQEMVLALWLIIKGFNPDAFASVSD
jgi:hypothetical protein